MIDSKKNNHLLIQPITRDTVLNTSPSAANNTFVVHESVVTEEPSRMLSRLQGMLSDSSSSSSNSDSKITNPQVRPLHGDRSVRKIQPQLMPQTTTRAERKIPIPPAAVTVNSEQSTLILNPSLIMQQPPMAKAPATETTKQ